MSDCSICLDKITNIFTTKCNHSFCNDCIDSWIRQHNNCPLCRRIITKQVKQLPKVNTSPYDENGNLINRRQNYLDLYLDGHLEYEELLNGAHRYH